MKRFVLALWLVGAALYTANTIVVTRDSVPVENATQPVASFDQAQSTIRDIPSWGPHLPAEPQRQAEQVERQQAVLPSPKQSSTPDAESRGETAAEVVNNKASSIRADDLDHAPVTWAKVMLAAKMHSKASVSSPILRYYPPGSELQVVRRENGWVLVVDPATAARGWIYEQYYLSWIGGPTSTQAALAPSDQTSQSPQSKPAPPKVTRRSGTAKAKSQRSEPWMVTEYRTGKWRTADRRRRMGFFVFGRFGGF
jgi:Bacterial SH3 domain